jgi:peptidoglycan/LPS O-acetylase OafA/YrhL
VRAFAVLAVIAYHFGVPGVHGGLLGVDVFFVLSGFLITSLLCREHDRSGRVALGAFWARRARRLLPGLLLLLVGVAVYARVFASTVDVSAVRADALSTLLYVANWHYIVAGQGYFAASGAPSPLLHTWSLGVEEQYYLVWPLVAAVVLQRWGTRVLAKVALGAAAVSATLMAVMQAAGFSADRLYYGSDTRAQALLIGSFLGAACGWRSAALGRCAARGAAPSVPERRRAWSAAGVAGGAALLFAWTSLDGQATFLYRGGFALVALAAAGVVGSVSECPGSPVGRLCALRPLAYVGRISYGLYLYHWPLCLAIDHQHTGLSGPALLACRLAATFAAAIASFHLVEEPVRTGSLSRGRHGVVGATAGALVAVGALLVATVVPAGGAPVRATAAAGSERRQLAALHAFTTNPVRFLLVGDSIALTMGIGLSDDSRSRYGVRIDNDSELGCDLDPTLEVRLSGQVGPATAGCPDWRATWSRLVRQDRPQVVGLLLGRWEVADHRLDGHWTHIGERLWDDHLSAEMQTAVHLLARRGASVVLFTMPYLDVPEEAPDGSPYPEDQPGRVDAYNALVERVSRRTGAHVVDLNALLDPSRRFAATIDGVDVRWSDGIHITANGGQWLQPRVLPTVDRLGLEARLSASSRSSRSAR